MLCTRLSSSRASGLCWLPRSPHARLCQTPHLGNRLQQKSRCQNARPSDRAGAAVTVKAQAATGAEGAPPQQRHAFLHDFCLCIPYGTLVSACGLLMQLFGGGQTALLIAGAGALQIVLSALSLKTWRARQPVAKLFTVLEAGVAGVLTYEAYKGLQRGVAQVPHVALGLLSAAMTLFLVYNLAAGGNPPPKEKAAAAA